MQLTLLSKHRSVFYQVHTKSAAYTVSRTPVSQLKYQTLHNSVPRDTCDLVSDVLRRIDDTDSGAALGDDDRRTVDAVLESLEQVGARQQPRPLQNERLYGNYNVAYVSTRTAPNQRGQPAGGRFRTPLGKFIFRTRGLYQSILKPDIVTNKVEFALFGFVPGHIGIRGRLQKAASDADDSVKVFFERPELKLPLVALRVGPKSTVELRTPYVDERVRLGLGSQGSRFVFTRGGPANRADLDRVGLHRTTALGWLLLASATATLAYGAAWLWTRGHLLARTTACGVGLVAALLTSAIWTDLQPLQRLAGMLRYNDP